MTNILRITQFLSFFSLLSCVYAQCDSSETTDYENIIDPYLNGGIFSITNIQVSCPGSLESARCNDFSNVIDSLVALGADGQCYLEAYEYYNQLATTNTIQCSFEDMVSLCPSATELPYAVDGGYGEWSDWSSCDCDTNEESRSRDCDSPQPVNDGLTCEEQNLGDSSETQSCTTTATNCGGSDEESRNSASGLTNSFAVAVLLVTFLLLSAEIN